MNLYKKKLSSFNRNFNQYIKNKEIQYLFKMISLKTKLIRTFTFQNQISGKIKHFTHQFDYDHSIQSINISKALTQITLKYQFNLTNSLLFYVDFQKKVDVYIGSFPNDELLLKKQNILCDIIKIRFKPIQQEINYQYESLSKRSIKQRTIKEGMKAVHKWLQIYNERNQQNQRIYTLQASAKIVGISKKTLSDYYKLIKQADEYKFDFNLHQYDKFGLLRGFIKRKTTQLKRKYSEQTAIDPDLFWALDNQQKII